MKSGIRKSIFKTFIKAICFLIVFCSINKALEAIIIPYFDDDTHQYTQFYNVKKDSVDVLLVGGSSILRGFSSIKLWGEFGITAEIRGSTSALPFISYLNIKEGLKYQSPQVIVVGINAIFDEVDLDADNMEGAMRRALDYRRLSVEKICAADTIIKNSDNQTLLSYIFPVMRYHDRWQELSMAELKLKLNENRYAFLHGQRPLMNIVATEPRWGLMVEKNPLEKAEFKELSKTYYDKIIDLCDKKGINLIFVATPKEDWSYSKYLAIKEYVEEKNVTYIDFNFDDILKECNIDWEADFSDPNHLNAIGAEKVTVYLGNYIEKNYSLDKDYSNEVIEDRNRDFKVYKEYMQSVFSE